MVAAIIEARAHRRRRSLKAARVILAGSSSIDCLIRDMSEQGARLEFPELTELPASFDLLVVSTGLLIPVRPAWQRGFAAGVQFASSMKATASIDAACSPTSYQFGTGLETTWAAVELNRPVAVPW